MSTTPEIDRAKQQVWDLWQPVRTGGDSVTVLERAGFADDVIFHGPVPLGSCTGADEMIEIWLQRMWRSFPRLERSPHLFLGGRWQDEVWVATTGEWSGNFEADFYGVPATGRRARLRFGEFYRVRGDAIVEVRMLFDLLGLAADAGYPLLPPFPAGAALPPPPALDNGISLAPADPAETHASLQLVEAMLSGCNRLVDGELRTMGMDAYWHDDMCWYGPWGIGSTVGYEQFQRWAQGPSVASFPNRRGGFHQARIADGVTAAFTGWPSLQGDFDGLAFRGIPPTGGPIGQNIMDFYIRRGDRLHENWVLIDLVDFALQCGVDLLASLPGKQ